MMPLLLHICCAPDATVPWSELINENYDVTGYFYGSNIHPQDEYQKRAEALKVLSDKLNGKAVFADYRPQEWQKNTEMFADEPEGGRRCEECFKLQLDAAAKYAKENGFTYISTTLTISPHKNVGLINSIGSDSAKRYDLTWVEKVWRKNNGFKRSVDESRRFGLYRQNYCGCVYSMRKDTVTGDAL